MRRQCLTGAKLNGLELNVKKTKAIIFGSAQNLSMLSCNLSLITISGSPIPYGKQVKNLGLLVTPTLDWQPRISAITNKIYASLSSLNFHRKSLNVWLRKQLIQSLALPHFDYASIIFMISDKTRSHALQTAQNACIRSIFGNITHMTTANITSHLTHRRLHLGWISIAVRHYQKIAVLAYSVISNRHPSYLSTLLIPTPKKKFSPHDWSKTVTTTVPA